MGRCTVAPNGLRNPFSNGKGVGLNPGSIAYSLPTHLLFVLLSLYLGNGKTHPNRISNLLLACSYFLSSSWIRRCFKGFLGASGHFTCCQSASPTKRLHICIQCPALNMYICFYIPGPHWPIGSSCCGKMETHRPSAHELVAARAVGRS